MTHIFNDRKTNRMVVIEPPKLPPSDARKVKPSNLMKEYVKDNRCRILSLDGGGAKGFYSLGVLKRERRNVGLSALQTL